MFTIAESLKAVNAYPIPYRVIFSICTRVGIDPQQEATTEEVVAKPYRKAEALIKSWLATAPNVSQGGQSYTIPDEQRKQLQREAATTLAELGQNANGVVYGYKGSKL
jgi:beta-phosphoglucomutase-like phosphatase (HAD superfamily)